MSQNSIIDTIERQEWLGKVGGAIQPVIIKAFEAGGSAGQKIKNLAWPSFTSGIN